MGVGAWTKRSRDKHGSSEIVQTLNIFLPYCPSNISLWARDYIEEGNSWKGAMWVQRISLMSEIHIPLVGMGAQTSGVVPYPFPSPGKAQALKSFQKLTSLYYSPSKNRHSTIKSIVKGKEKQNTNGITKPVELE